MKPYPVDSFHGGMIDEFDSAPSHYAQRMRNFMLDAAGKMYERPGTQLWSSLQTPSAERITNLRVFQNLTKADQTTTQKAAFAYSNRKIWVSSGGNISAGTGPVAWTELTDQGTTANPAAYNADIFTRAKMQQKTDHVYVSFFNRKAESVLQHPRVKKIYPRQTGFFGGIQDDYWRMANVGLPTPTATAGSYTTSGGSGNTYLYYVVLAHTYYIGSTGYLTLSAPSPVINVIDKTAAIGPGSAVRITFPWPTNNDVDKNCYPLVEDGITDFSMRIYRTKKGETLPRLAGTVPYTSASNTSIFDDVVPDASLGEPIYTANGATPYEQPPPCKLMHIVGDTAYYGHWACVGIASGNGTVPAGYAQSIRPPELSIIQSVPGVIDSGPADFTIPTPAIPVAIDSVDYHPIIFFENSVWRVEGQIDEFGNGSPVLRPISEVVGLLDPNGVVKIDRGLLFTARDGVYFTDGFSVKLLTGHVGKTWAQMSNYLTSTAIQQMSGAFDTSTKKFFIAHHDAKIAQGMPSPVSNIANAMIVGDMGHQNQEGGVAISELNGEQPRDGTAYPFFPTFLESFDDTLLMGDLNGYITKMTPETEPDFDIYNGYDVQTHASNSPSTFKQIPVVPDYISAALDLGNNIFKKWVTKMILRFKMPAKQTKIFAQVTSHNDMSFREDVYAELSNPKNLKEVRETAVPTYRRIYAVARRFAKGQIRCLYKQVQIKKSFTVLYASIPAGTRAYAKVVTSAAGNTAQLQSGTWPTDIVGQSLYLSDDNYVRSWAILSVSGDTVTVYDPSNNFPENGAIVAREWMIRGYPKDVKLGVHGYTLMFTDIEGKEDQFQTTDTGAN